MSSKCISSVQFFVAMASRSRMAGTRFSTRTTEPPTFILPMLKPWAAGSATIIAGLDFRDPSDARSLVYSNLLVLVRNKHAPAPAHDGKGFSEVIDESSDGRQHASGRREDQVDDPCWRAPLGQDVDERATAHVVHATVLGQERHAEPRERGGTQHPEVETVGNRARQPRATVRRQGQGG